MFSAPTGGMNLAELGIKMRQAEFLYNRQLYSEHEAIYTLRVKNNHLIKMYNHKDNIHLAKTCFSIEIKEPELGSIQGQWESSTNLQAQGPPSLPGSS